MLLLIYHVRMNIRKGASMKKNYGLTKTEEQIMELLWASQTPMTFREIMDIATSEWG